MPLSFNRSKVKKFVELTDEEGREADVLDITWMNNKFDYLQQSTGVPREITEQLKKTLIPMPLDPALTFDTDEEKVLYYCSPNFWSAVIKPFFVIRSMVMLSFFALGVWYSVTIPVAAAPSSVVFFLPGLAILAYTLLRGLGDFHQHLVVTNFRAAIVSPKLRYDKSSFAVYFAQIFDHLAEGACLDFTIQEFSVTAFHEKQNYVVRIIRSRTDPDSANIAFRMWGGPSVDFFGAKRIGHLINILETIMNNLAQQYTLNGDAHMASSSSEISASIEKFDILVTQQFSSEAERTIEICVKNLFHVIALVSSLPLALVGIFIYIGVSDPKQLIWILFIFAIKSPILYYRSYIYFLRRYEWKAIQDHRVFLLGCFTHSTGELNFRVNN